MGISTKCTHGCAFSLTSLLIMAVGGHTIYVMKAEYFSYSKVPVTELCIKKREKYIKEYVRNLNFYHNVFKYRYFGQYLMKCIQIFCVCS